MPLRRLLAPAILATFLAGCVMAVQQEPPPPPPRKRAEPAKVEGNIPIENSDFEREAGNPRPWETVVHAIAHSYEFDVVAEAARTGNAGIRIRKAANEPWGGIVQAINVAAPTGQKGRLSGWVRAPALEGEVVFFVRLIYQRGQPLDVKVTVPAERNLDDWQQIAVDFETERQIYQIWVGATLYGGDYIDLDDFELSFH